MPLYNSIHTDAAALAARYDREPVAGKSLPVTEFYYVSAYTDPDYPVIASEPQVQVCRWGLVPGAPEVVPDIRSTVYRVRGEALFGEPGLREAALTGRCIVPSTGWFDWRYEDKEKIPYFIRVRDEAIFSMAGIRIDSRDPQSGRTIRRFAVITTRANSMMSYIHNTNFRMPALLGKSDEARWLDPALGRTDVEELLVPFDSKSMEAYPVDPDFTELDPRDPEVVRAREFQPGSPLSNR